MNAAHQTGANRDASLRRVAIVLSSLPSPVSAKLLASFDDAMRRSLRRTMTSLSDVDPLERQRALQAFKGSLESQQQRPARSSDGRLDEIQLQSNTINSNSSAASSVVKHDRESAAPTGSDSIPHTHTALSFLGDTEDEVLVAVIDGEHPQAIALVLASISPAQAARILPQLDGAVQKDALSRIGRLNDVPEEAVQELAAHLRNRVQQCLSTQQKRASQSTGQRALNAILAAMPQPKSEPPKSESHTASGPATPSQTSRETNRIADVTDSAIEDVQIHSLRIAPETQSTSAADRGGDRTGDRTLDRTAIHANSRKPQTSSLSTDAIHQHLISLTPLDLCQALGQVGTRQAMLTLCGLPNATAEAALRVLPKAYAKQVRSQMNTLGSLELREIDEAKSAVATASMQRTSAASPEKPTAMAA
ncbi:FliG C-terminal domain-containing protein [Novipirellula caenicola]|uniref:Flagellar motor switch protein FliG n=1 Tax=Novipirellula caenicola TaxID=1536901 RepID=A0ABP9VZY3_9BACT